MTTKMFLIEQSTAQRIADYLVTRPYIEVFPLVASLQDLAVAPPPGEGRPAERRAGPEVQVALLATAKPASPAAPPADAAATLLGLPPYHEDDR